MRSVTKAKAEVFPTEEQIVGRAKATAYFWRLYNLAWRLSKCLSNPWNINTWPSKEVIYGQRNMEKPVYSISAVLNRRWGYIQSPGKSFQTIERIEPLLLPGEWEWKKMRMLFGKNSQVIPIFIPWEENHC